MNSNDPIAKGILQKIINRVPGELSPVQSKKEKQGYVNINEKSKSDLVELIERQNKLLNNKAFVNKLPDKGEKIINFKKQLEEELENRVKENEFMNQLSLLNMNGKEEMDKLEWTGKCNPGHLNVNKTHVNCNDVEDEKVDPLKIIANHSGTSFNKRINRVIPPEEPLIKLSEIEEIEANSHNDTALENNSALHSNSITTTSLTDNNIADGIDSMIDEPYVKNLCNKFDQKLLNKNNAKEKFLPHKTIKPRGSNEFKDVKLISLETSVKLQMQQAEKLKEVQLKHATEKLKSMSGKKNFDSLKFNVKSPHYRNPREHYDSDCSDDDNKSEDGYHSCNNNEEEEDDITERRGAITFYNLIDD